MRVRTRTGAEVTVSVEQAVERISAADYVHWYDALPAGEPNQVTVTDLALPAFLDAVPNFKALLMKNKWSNLECMLKAASDRLRMIPTEKDLTSWDDTEENRAALKGLFQACTGGSNPGFPEFGPARCTKLLHKKRPRLIPIVDSWQLEAWSKRSASWSTDDMVDVVFLIKGEMNPQIRELVSVQKELEDKHPSLPQLSTLRIYDILFWEWSRT